MNSLFFMAFNRWVLWWRQRWISLSLFALERMWSIGQSFVLLLSQVIVNEWVWLLRMMIARRFVYLQRYWFVMECECREQMKWLFLASYKESLNEVNLHLTVMNWRIRYLKVLTKLHRKGVYSKTVLCLVIVVLCLVVVTLLKHNGRYLNRIFMKLKFVLIIVRKL